MSLKTMSVAQLQQRKRACKAFGVDSEEIDRELKSRSYDPTEQRRVQAARAWYRDQFEQSGVKHELKALSTGELQARYGNAIKAGLTRIAPVIADELKSRGVQPGQRRQRVVWSPGSTCGGLAIRFIDEE